MKYQDTEIKKLHQQLTKLENDNMFYQNQYQNLVKESRENLDKMKKQLQGSVRRINYLVEEKERFTVEAKEKNAYISKLEVKIGILFYFSNF